MTEATRAKSSSVTPIAPPLVVTHADGVNWSDTADVVVVGWGGAGACAALEAHAHGAEVLVLERFSGGGATALSGGVVYAGGGTPYQRAAGFDDSPGAMAAYLRHEVGAAVSETTLQAFCQSSVANLAWLETHGVRFGSSLPKHKTSYPPDGVYLYHSGNETVPAYRTAGQPAPPRGHRVVAKGQSGATLYAALQTACLNAGVRVRTQAAVRRLVLESGSRRVLGVEVWQLPAGHADTRRHAELDACISRWRLYQPGKAEAARREQARIEQAHARPYWVRARRGVVLSTGGYVYNPELMKAHAPQFRRGWPIGGAGCDGSALRLGQGLGAATRALDNISAWRFITPPSMWPKGIVVNAEGRRFCNEQVYGATLGHEMMAHQGGRAWLVIDRRLRWQAVRECLFGRLWAFQALPALLLMFKVARKGRSVPALAARIGVDAANLRDALAQVGAAARGAATDPMGKSADMCHAFREGPFWAIDIGIAQRLFPLAVLSLGGLVVNEADGHVQDEQGHDIRGLFAAGRSAIGLASSRYVSGLSLADCVFSGRRAGRAAAVEPRGWD